MPVTESPDDTDNRLRELFHSFDASSVGAAHPARVRVARLSRGRALAWAGVLAAALVIALVSVHIVQSRTVRTPAGLPSSKGSVRACATSQLTAAVAFDQPGTPLGAVRLSNTAGTSCALSGQPKIVVFDSAGHTLSLIESTYHRAPDLPAPASPVELAASSSSPQAIVELDWCGFQTSGGRVEIRFSGWTEPLVEQASSFKPLGFSPPTCPDPSQKLFAVDYVRSLRTSGVVSAGASVTVTPARDLHSGEVVQLSARGLVPHAAFYVSESASTGEFFANPLGCGIRERFRSTDGSGNASIDFHVNVVASSGSGRTASSTVCTDRCVIVASAGAPPDESYAYAPIQFAPLVVQHTPACRFSQLTVTSGSPHAGLGHVGVVLLFKNVGSETCTLFGYPGVAGLNAQGVQITQAVRTQNGYLGGAGQSVSDVILVPVKTASAIVEGTDVPTGNATTCPTYASLLVTPPNTTQSVKIDVSLPGCSGLQVHPIVPGSTGSGPG